MTFKVYSLKEVYRQEEQKKRLALQKALAQILIRKGYTGSFRFFRSSGRTELGGNHTDHNLGLVLASSIDLDIMACATPTAERRVCLFSHQYKKPYQVDLSHLKVGRADNHTTEGLVRGMAFYLQKAGANIGGFTASLASLVPAGSGLSSSAAFTVLIGLILNALYNAGRLSPITIAQAAQQAENNYYGKPCGLMDQLVIATGGVIAIDFKDQLKPRIIPLSLDLKAAGYELLILNCGGSHSSLTSAYTEIRCEMAKVASFFKKEYLREVSPKEFRTAIPKLRQTLSDRAILRAMHYFKENERVRRQIRALEQKDYQTFLRLVNESGSSSYQLLQNCYLQGSVLRQEVALALALTKDFLGQEGACRVHGGGFAGTIQTYVPSSRTKGYLKMMRRVFGPGAALPLQLTQSGACELSS